MSNFNWNPQSIEAAQLLAAGDLTSEAIAEKVGVTSRTLRNWKHDPEFAARVEEHLDEIRAEVRRRGIASLENRVKALNDRWNRLRRIVEARADHPDYAEAPGGTTGLLVKTLKQLGGGESAIVVKEFAVDTGLLRELREHEKQAAQELGQWTDKQEVSGKLTGDVAVSSPELEKAASEIEAWRKEMLSRLSNTSSVPPTPPTSLTPPSA